MKEPKTLANSLKHRRGGLFELGGGRGGGEGGEEGDLLALKNYTMTECAGVGIGMQNALNCSNNKKLLQFSRLLKLNLAYSMTLIVSPVKIRNLNKKS